MMMGAAFFNSFPCTRFDYTSPAGDALNRIQAVIFEDWGDARLSESFRLKGFCVERLDGNNCLASNLALS